MPKRKQKFICKCGREFDSQIDFRIHYEILRVNPVQVSTLSGITQEMADKRQEEVDRFLSEHGLKEE